MSNQLTSKEWSALIQNYHQSEFSPSEFCRHHDIDLKAFKSQQRKLKAASDEDNPFISVSPPTAQEIESARARLQQNYSSLRLDVGACQLYIPASVTPQWLAQVIREITQ